MAVSEIFLHNDQGHPRPAVALAMGPPILKRNGRCGAPSCSTFSIPPDSSRAVSPGASVGGQTHPLWEPPGPLRARARADLGRKPPQAGHGSTAPSYRRRPRGNSRRSDRSPRRARSRAALHGGVSTPARSSVSPQAGNQNIRASRASTRRTSPLKVRPERSGGRYLPTAGSGLISSGLRCKVQFLDAGFS